jgi:hypothetical protein
MTGPSIAQDDSAVCEHVCDLGDPGTSVMIVERTRPNDGKVSTS